MLTYSDFDSAKKAAEEKVRELHNGNPSVVLTAKQSRDVAFAFERLKTFNAMTGRGVSIYEAVVDFVGAATIIGKERSLVTAAHAFVKSIGSVKPCTIAVAVDEFATGLQAKAQAPAGQRAQLSQTYAYNTGLWLRRFAGQFPMLLVSDLQKENLDAFMESLGALAPKSRNHYRATLRTFLEWCVRKDYLAIGHRLFQAPSMVREVFQWCGY